MADYNGAVRTVYKDADMVLNRLVSVNAPEWRITMEKKPIRQIYPLETYLKKIINENIRSDQDVQRMSGQWDNNMINELMVTVLSDDYIPPIILGEQVVNESSQLYIIEGLQRSTSLSLFKYGNYKITSNVENYMVEYQRQLLDKDGKVKKDKDGNIICETLEFDIRNKTYNDLPEELKNRFNEYQLETVVHEDCTMQKMSQLVRRYNNHKPMNTSQKAFTYVDNYAREIRNIVNNNRFLKDCGQYTQKERNNGTLERMVMESVMCMFHPDNWQKQSKKISSFLNEHSSKQEFEKLDDNMRRLEKIYSEDMKDIFTSKDSFIWFALFDRFTALGIDDSRFAEFLTEFKNNLCNKRIGGKSFYEIEENHSTKDKSVVIKKLKLLVTLMEEFLCINKDMKKDNNTDVLSFLKENVSSDIEREDIGLYKDILDDLIINAGDKTELSDNRNRPSLLAVVAYACHKDMDLDEWFVKFFENNTIYAEDQKKNYQIMVKDLNKFFK